MIPPDGRVAIYYAPTEADPLFTAATSWLGRDPSGGSSVAQPDILDIADITAEPRLYGFHGTLKPPMRLADGRAWPELLHATRALADRIAPFSLPLLAVTDLHGFLALRETEACPPLQALADCCVEELDAFRAPPLEAELARRRRSKLTAEQDAMLQRWGYPYVFKTWFFHLTLTRRLSPEEKSLYQPAAERHFAASIAEARRVTDICLFIQPAPGQPFVIAERLPLLG